VLLFLSAMSPTFPAPSCPASAPATAAELRPHRSSFKLRSALNPAELLYPWRSSDDAIRYGHGVPQ
jgi:hypothetical protein